MQVALESKVPGNVAQCVPQRQFLVRAYSSGQGIQSTWQHAPHL